MKVSTVGLDLAKNVFQVHAVAGRLDQTPAIFSDLGVDQFLAISILTGERPGFVGRHETAVADHVGGKNGGKPAFQTLSPSPRRLTTMDRRIHAVGMVLECLLLAMNGPDSS